MHADAAYFEKIAYDAFADELLAILAASREKAASELLDGVYDQILETYGDDYVKTASDAELEELVKTAFIAAAVRRFPVLGMPAGQGLKQIGQTVSAGARRRIMPVAGRMANSQNRFVQGMGDALAHKADHSPMRAILNPVGTAAEVATASGGNLAAQGLANRGASMAAAPAGTVQQRFGAGMHRVFSAGGGGHAALTKVIPRAAELGGAVGTGLATGLPVGAAGLLGKGVTAAGVGTAKALGAGAVAEGIGHAAHTALGHGAEDLVGTFKQNWAARRMGAHH